MAKSNNKKNNNSDVKKRRSEAAIAASQARKFERLKAEYNTQLNSKAVEKALEFESWEPIFDNPVTKEEFLLCMKDLQEFLARNKHKIPESQLDQAQAWVTGIEARNFNAVRQQEILTLANTDVKAARHAAQALMKEYKMTQKNFPMKEEKFSGRIEIGVSNYYKYTKRRRFNKKQKPILKSSAKKGSGFAPKYFDAPVVEKFDAPTIVVATYNSVYNKEYEAYKQAYLAGVREERERLAKEELKRQQKAEELKRLEAERKRKLQEAKAKAAKEAANKAKEDFRKFVALHQAAMQLLLEGKQYRSTSNMLDKRMSQLEANLEADFFTLKKKYDFAASALFHTQEQAA